MSTNNEAIANEVTPSHPSTIHEQENNGTPTDIDHGAQSPNAKKEEDVESQSEKPAPAAPAITFPDGGAKAWLTVLGGCLAFTASVGFTNSYSVFQSYYRTKTLSTYSDQDIAWIGSIQLWGAFFFGLPAGKLSDKFGPKIPLALATIFIVLGTMMASISKHYYQFFLSQGLCSCIGYGLVLTPALSLPAQWFAKKRGLAVGCVVSGTSIGGIIWPIMINRMLNYDGISLGWTLRAVGFIQLFLMIISVLLVNSRFPRNMQKQPPPIKLYFTNKLTLIFTFGVFLVFLSLYVPYFFITPYGIRWRASPQAAFYYPAIMNAASFFGRFAIGILADRKMGFYNATTVFTFISAICAFGWIGARSNAGNIVWSVVFGFFSGSLQSLLSPCLAQVAPSPTMIGTWVGIGITTVSFAVLGSQPIAGRLLDNEKGIDYVPMQLYVAFMLLGGSFVLVYARILRNRTDWKA